MLFLHLCFYIYFYKLNGRCCDLNVKIRTRRKYFSLRIVFASSPDQIHIRSLNSRAKSLSLSVVLLVSYISALCDQRFQFFVPDLWNSVISASKTHQFGFCVGITIVMKFLCQNREFYPVNIHFSHHKNGHNNVSLCIY